MQSNRFPIKLISDNGHGTGWLTDYGTYVLDTEDSLYIVHGIDVDTLDNREYFNKIKIQDDEIKLKFGRNIFNIKDLISMAKYAYEQS